MFKNALFKNNRKIRWTVPPHLYSLLRLGTADLSGVARGKVRAHAPGSRPWKRLNPYFQPF